MTTPTIGRIVHYKLTKGDAQEIQRKRLQAGHATFSGNTAAEGDVFPALIVRVWDEPKPSVQLQVFPDGNDTYWATSRYEGAEAGQWAWPAR